MVLPIIAAIGLGTIGRALLFGVGRLGMTVAARVGTAAPAAIVNAGMNGANIAAGAAVRSGAGIAGNLAKAAVVATGSAAKTALGATGISSIVTPAGIGGLVKTTTALTGAGLITGGGFAVASEVITGIREKLTAGRAESGVSEASSTKPLKDVLYVQEDSTDLMKDSNIAKLSDSRGDEQMIREMIESKMQR